MWVFFLLIILITKGGDRINYEFVIYKKHRHSHAGGNLLCLFVPAGQWIPAVAGMTCVDDNEAYGFKIYEHRPSKKHRHSVA